MKKVCFQWWCRFLMILFWFSSVVSPSLLMAQSRSDDPKEPIWVMSWAMFVFFIAGTIALLARSRKRAETLLTNDERRQIAEQMLARIAAQKKAQMKAAAEAQRTSQRRN